MHRKPLKSLDEAELQSGIHVFFLSSQVVCMYVLIIIIIIVSPKENIRLMFLLHTTWFRYLGKISNHLYEHEGFQNK